MTKTEVSKIMAVLAAAYSRFEVNDVKLQLWFEMLGDIPYELAQIAVRKLICESSYPPSISDIRNAAAEIIRTDEDKVDAGSAWGEVMEAVRCYGTYGVEEAISSMSRRTAKVVNQIGWREICLSENLGVIRGQFMKIYNILEERDRREQLIPIEMKRRIREISGNIKMLGDTSSED